MITMTPTIGALLIMLAVLVWSLVGYIGLRTDNEPLQIIAVINGVADVIVLFAVTVS